jgi:superfamily II DNA/RNA helicase
VGVTNSLAAPGRASLKELPSCLPSFKEAFEARIPSWLTRRLEELKFETPTAVQLRALDVALPSLSQIQIQEIGGDGAAVLGRDTVIHAQTGCGKTLAYLIPAIGAVDPNRASVQALILVPTQELGMQIYKTLKRLTVAWSHAEKDASGSAFPVLPMLNQADLRRQKLQLRKTAPRIIIGNPHRVAALVESGRLRLDLLRVLVVDEFDACLLDTSTTSALQTVLGVRGRYPRQTILASATVPQHRHFLRQCVRQRWTNKDIEHVWVEEIEGQRVPSTLTHAYSVVDGRKKLSAMRVLLQRFGRGSASALPRAIVFIMMSRPVLPIVDALNSALRDTDGGASPTSDDRVVGLADDMTVLQRARAMRRFRRGDASVLVATDVAARGLDVDGITHVFHLDLPTDADVYLHRAGRAGRLGREGISVSLVTMGEEFVIRRTANSLGIDFKRLTQESRG